VPIKPMPRCTAGAALAGAFYRPVMPPALPPAPVRQAKPAAQLPPAPVQRGALVYWPPVVAAGAASILLVAGFLWLVSASSPRLPAEERSESIALAQPGAQENKPETSPPLTPAPLVETKPEKAKVEAKPAEPEMPKVLVEKKAPEVCKPPTSLLGTSVEFVDNPATAARTAAREEKLLFVLHVSGNFEDPAFT
jgi:hypothetical protein